MNNTNKYANICSQVLHLFDNMALDQHIDEPEKEMSFLEHLEALRWHLLRSILAVIIVAIGVFLAKDFVFNTVIFGPKDASFVTYRFLCSIADMLCFSPDEFQVLTRDLGEQFITHLKVSFWLGLIIAFPYVFWEIWRFVKPGLLEKEQKVTRGIVLICTFLFFTGVLFGYYVISPFAITFFSKYDVGAINAPTLASYVNYMTMFTIPAGITFELPIVVYFLAKAGLVTADFMRSYRKHAFIIILIVASIITPPDVVSQLLISAPLYGLYEISVRIAERVQKNVEK